MKLTGLIFGAAAAAFGVTAASAAPVTLTWTTTLQLTTGAIMGVSGEDITTTFVVDNGGASTLSQSWDSSDFVSYRIEGASGWWAESSSIVASANAFETDAAGLVTDAATWFGGFPGSPVTTSWGGAGLGGWWNNGGNEVFCTDGPDDCVFANNVQDNTVGSSWVAELDVAPIPLPAGLPLMIGGFALLGGLRLRKKRSI